MRKKRINNISSIDTVTLIENPIHECKNCSTKITGHFCSFCGQRYHAHKESFGELVFEFASDFSHFDSRFFKTLLPLLFSPGKLTKSYNQGKQRSQFHPIRLYLFSSFVYFFLFFYYNNVEENFVNNTNKNSSAFIVDSAMSVIQKDSLKRISMEDIDSTQSSKNNITNSVVDSNSKSRKFVALADSNRQYSFTVTASIDSLLKKKVTPEEYLKQQKSLSSDKRVGYLERIITVRLLKINLEGEEGKKEFFKKLIGQFFHNIPKMLFFLLPIFALWLKLLYIRRKQFYFVDHAILSLHYFSFIFLLLVFSNYILDKIIGTSIFTSIATIWIFLYLLLAMKKLYAQSWIKTIFKYITLGFLFTFTVLITLIANMAWTALMM